MDVVKDLEKRFLPMLHNMAKEINAEFPHVKTKVQSHSVGSATDFQGHSVALECCLPDVSIDQPDNIVLEITVKHINSKPEISSLDVCWGHPSGEIELFIAPENPECNDALFNDIEDFLPELSETLKMAIKRGRPPEEDTSQKSGKIKKQTELFSPENVIAGTLLAWLIGIVISIFVVGPNEIIHGGRAFFWHKSNCTVEENKFEKVNGDTPALLVKVRYEFGGKQRIATCRLTGDSQKHLQRQADLFLHPGDQAVCRINPDDPEQIILDKEYTPFEVFFMMSISMTVISFVTGLVLFWIGMTRTKRRSDRIRFFIRKSAVLACCSFILIFCGGAAIFGIIDALRTYRSLGWTKVEATIKQSKVSEVRDGEIWDYKTSLRYVYEFDGKQYEGDRWSLFDDNISTGKKMREAVGSIKSGDVVPCYVNPQNPQQSVLELHANSFWMLLAFPLILAAAVFGIWSELRDKYSSPEDTKKKQSSLELLPPEQMPQLPFSMQYELNRRQRLVPHIMIWLPYLPVILIFFACALTATLTRSWLYVFVLFGVIWYFRSFFMGLLTVAIHRMEPMDLVVGEDVLGYLIGNERLYIFLDGILKIEKYCKDTWTIQHNNGTIISIPAALISDEQIGYMKYVAERPKDSEYIKNAVERDRNIE
jgi:hypothetical protein